MTEKRTLDVDGVMGLLRKIVFEKGADFTYHKVENSVTCHNFHGDEPGCIVGHVLVELGLDSSLAQRLRIEGSENAAVSCDRLSRSPEFDWAFDEDTVQVLTVAQVAQDDGKTWGEALGRAESRALEIRQFRADLADDLC